MLVIIVFKVKIIGSSTQQVSNPVACEELNFLLLNLVQRCVITKKSIKQKRLGVSSGFDCTRGVPLWIKGDSMIHRRVLQFIGGFCCK